ncbi:MAG: deoxyribodipyrimidine photo-lyase [Bryobacteraceae bacterium]
MKDRVRVLNSAGRRPAGEYVLYWSQMNRRVESNHALLFAVETANDLNLPVLVYEGLTCSYPYASDRFHHFILEGVSGTGKALANLGIGYVFYLRRKSSDPNDVLYRLASRAAAVVTDDYPTFVAARHNASVASKLDVSFSAVDSSCVVPMGLLGKREYAAYTIRPKIHKLLPKYLRPAAAALVRKEFTGEAGEFHTQITTANIDPLVASCEIDHGVRPAVGITGGERAAQKRLTDFLVQKLSRYAGERNEPSAHATSGLSPYLHFGQISSLQVALAAQSYAREHKLIADEFLEELIVRRELAFNFARYAERVDSLDVLPDWARETMRKHSHDRREPSYTREQLEHAQTYDALWNATQNELLLRGTIHGYYRMYWGKKIIEWSATYEAALQTMIYLHDRYALDGRDPNTYTNILWCFGLHDRPWPERKIFGTMRYMSFDGMRRKTDVDAYIREIAGVTSK